jgi:hypothetical protein
MQISTRVGVVQVMVNVLPNELATQQLRSYPRTRHHARAAPGPLSTASAIWLKHLQRPLSFEMPEVLLGPPRRVHQGHDGWSLAANKFKLKRQICDMAAAPGACHVMHNCAETSAHFTAGSARFCLHAA